MDFLKIKTVIDSLTDFMSELDNKEYTTPIKSLSGSSLGEHTRHIIELFRCLDNGYVSGEVSYENRKRELTLQNDISSAKEAIKTILDSIIKEDKDLSLVSTFIKVPSSIETSYYRELVFCVEHCIHHQALIKVGLIELKRDSLINSEFGVAPCTTKYKENVHT